MEASKRASLAGESAANSIWRSARVCEGSPELRGNSANRTGGSEIAEGTWRVETTRKRFDSAFLL